MTGESIVEASAESEGYMPTVNFTLNSEGARLWERITEENINRSIAVVMNGSVLFSPIVTSVIREGKSSITADFTEEETSRLAILLGSGHNKFGVKVTGIK
jgi:SecD/SecF fusion protein